MPEVWRQTEPDFRIIIWHSIEPLAELFLNASLTDKENAEYQSFRSETRKREWLTVRNILKFLLPDEHHTIRYNHNGRPMLIGQTTISISHSNDFIAVMIGNGNRIGIDLEMIHPRIIGLSRKFLNEEETAFITENDKLEMLHVIWGAKEVLFKIHSIGSIDFKKDLLVCPFQYNPDGIVRAFIKKKSFEKDFIVYYKKFKEYMISWSTENSATTI
jgi:4'-phosphopantetheinyl transferase